MVRVTGPTAARIRRGDADSRYGKMGPSQGPPTVRAKTTPLFAHKDCANSVSARKHTQSMAKRRKKKPPATAGPLTVSDRIQRQLAASAIEKTRQGQRPTFREQAALKALEAERDTLLRWTHYHTTPKSHYVLMAGREGRSLNRQADRHGIPIRGRTVDLAAVIHWIHDLLAKHGQRLAGLDDADSLLVGTSSPALERYRRAKGKLAEFELERQQGNLISKDRMGQALSGLNTILRECALTLQREYGDDAAALMTDAVKDWARGWREILSDEES